ncbi:MAG: helix-turn-helix domain-containing protein [Gelidibacter sp.]|nr:helix-turn-helix domain-containing protein [Gelidibacter sp.]
MENTKTIFLHNITPFEFKEMIIADLKIEIEKIILKSNKPEYYDVSEVSKILNVSNLTVYNYIKKGTLPAIKIGRKFQISRLSLEDALKEVKSLKYKR